MKYDLVGSESATFSTKKLAETYGRGNMIRFRVSGPHIDKYNNSKYYIVGGTTKHHSERKYHSMGYGTTHLKLKSIGKAKNNIHSKGIKFPI